MLTELRLENLAIIDKVELSFLPGFNVLTGETGAGKSIIVDAVSLLLGAKGGGELVRTGAEEAIVEGLFQAGENSPVLSVLQQSGYEGGEALIVKRRISSSGRSRFYLNGSLAPASLVASLRPHLVTVCGQHEYQTLLNQEHHLDVLDAYAGLTASRQEYATLYRQRNELKEKLALAYKKKEEREEKAQALRQAANELDAAQLNLGEEEMLKERRKILANAQTLYQLAGEALELLYSQRGAALEDVALASEKAKRISEIDPSFKQIKERLEGAQAELEDIALGLRQFMGRIDLDPQELERTEERLDILARLKRKYGLGLDQLIEHLKGLNQELDALHLDSNRLDQLNKLEQETTERLIQKAFELSCQRARAARQLAQKLAAELTSLGMDKVTFLVAGLIAENGQSLDQLSENTISLGPHGMDQVEFLFSANPGEEPRPLMKVASGGELSRLTLALKTVSSGWQTPPTLIFDEVDAGISGAVSEVLGKRIREVAGGSQVLCVTHLPQIARFGHAHFYVEKQEIAGRTLTRVAQLKGEARVKEIARMLAGREITPAVHRHARELLERL